VADQADEFARGDVQVDLAQGDELAVLAILSGIEGLSDIFDGDKFFHYFSPSDVLWRPLSPALPREVGG
jgi:hypothetical protein